MNKAPQTETNLQELCGNIIAGEIEMLAREQLLKQLSEFA